MFRDPVLTSAVLDGLPAHIVLIDRSGVLRTTLALLRVFLEREDTLLVEGALGGNDPEGLSLRDRAWLTYTQVGAALRLQKRMRAIKGATS